MKINERGRGKFKPAPNYDIKEVNNILMEKISNEVQNIHEDDNDLGYIEDIGYDSKKYNMISLFSGCGGLDLGFELAGLINAIGEKKALKAFENKNIYNSIRDESLFHTIYTNDMFKEANESYKENFNKTVFQHEKDIRKVKYFPKADIVVGGFPCPGFSEAGPRLIDDERNFLYIHFIRCLIQSQPDIFVAENVKGMLTLGKGEVIKQIIEDFSAAGYDVKYKLLNSKDYGVPQLRERVFIVGVKKGIEFNYQFPEPTHGTSKGLIPYVNLEKAIGHLRSNPGPFFTGSYSTIYLSRNRKKSWDELSFTIQASGRQAPLHPDGPPMEKISPNKWILPGGEETHRRLSVKEIAAIQTFPDWFVFSNGNSVKSSINNKLDKQYKQIGNAVPVLLAKAVAEPIADFAIKQINNRTKKNNQKNILQLNLF